MHKSYYRFRPKEGAVAENGPRRSVNTVSVFISPNSRNQNYLCQTHATSRESHETSFDEIENLRAEVKRLSDIVAEQSELLSCIQTALSEKSSETKPVERLDLLTEFDQHKMAVACMERDNVAMESMIRQLESAVASLTVTVGHQCNELLLLRNAVRELYVGAGGGGGGVGEVASEHSSASPQMRSVSCSELQANCVSFGAPECREQRRRVVRSYTSRLPPSDQHCQSQQSWRPQRQNSCPTKSGSIGKLNSLMVFLKSPKISLRKASPHSNQLRTSTYPLMEDESLSETAHANGTPWVPPLLLPTCTDFESWSVDQVCDFLQRLGLEYCQTAARKWIRTGADIINAGSAQLQQNLVPLKPLHLKKLLIHVSLRTTQDMMATRETAFLPAISPHPDFNISKWLDDIGLPMYKPSFEAELIDAYVLHELTLSELQTLGVNNELHMVSMRRGLQLLRQLNFDLTRLCRCPVNSSCSALRALQGSCSTGTPGDLSQTSPEVPARMMESAHSIPALRTTQPSTLTSPSNTRRSTSVSVGTVCRESTPSRNPTPNSHSLSPSPPSSSSSSSSSSSFLLPPTSPALWTSHRMETWLCNIDLPEYVSSLRSSGLHGALLLYEDRFTAETLADVLDIGPERTLLRRHLSEEFANLLDSSLCHRKQRSTIKDSTVAAPVLNPSAKLKLVERRSSIRRMFDVSGGVNTSGVRYLGSDLLCPLEADCDFKNSSLAET
ncbi:Liprin-beta-1 [Taenia crassiceps]|uniref:Liprin-beta-1 n=1 Tax=Taenia crassiceps TaxID=6207 RepID=A0ABR4QMS9_9CEST